MLAGGTESMSNAIFYLSDARWGVGTGTTQLKDSLTEAQFCSQPQDIYGRFNMGITAENIFDTDEFPRETSLKLLSRLKPAFLPPDGTVTAGNSSGRNDGASMLVLMDAQLAEEQGLKPLARILGVASAGVNPRYMGLGPVPATQKALEMAGLRLDDIQLIELNEAFAAQSIGCIRELGLQDRMGIINVNGGAIALGHPIGSSGSRILVTLVHEMNKRGLRYGLATLCIAGGMGMATVVETVQ